MILTLILIFISSFAVMEFVAWSKYKDVRYFN